MDSEVNLYMLRAENELDLAEVVFSISGDNAIKKNFRLNENDTFYSAAISHAYYSIFYSAKAILLSEGIKTESPEVHRKTLEAFEKHMVRTGKLDVELLKIYKKMIVRAEELLGIFFSEKKKRGEFTYQTIAQANIPFAEESLRNAKKFVANIREIIKKIQEEGAKKPEERQTGPGQVEKAGKENHASKNNAQRGAG